ncbi:MAG: major capsid protein [Polaromonas sp.]|uniref:major capsid protein n=1 Tax=Polaromonas sp. TaxID=1869339 RepID=UPI002736232B|nr:major capsid protein [Polaromonas sp.]MDP2818316.1 major capsid protein [Polaromonas sp.]
MLKNLKSYVLAMMAFALSALQSAHAALDTAVTTELTTARADIITIGGIVFGIAVAIVLYKWFKRAL